jgi:hypothetical protein
MTYKYSANWDDAIQQSVEAHELRVVNLPLEESAPYCIGVQCVECTEYPCEGLLDAQDMDTTETSFRAPWGDA